MFICVLQVLLKVQLSTTLSEEFDQEAGVPQLGTLSTSLFMLKISIITPSLSHDIDDFLYVDDFVIIFLSKYVSVAERKLQIVLNKLTKSADCNGFTFSKDKMRIFAVNNILEMASC